MQFYLLHLGMCIKTEVKMRKYRSRDSSFRFKNNSGNLSTIIGKFFLMCYFQFQHSTHHEIFFNNID